MAVRRVQQVEDLLEHEMVETGASCLLDLGAIPSFPRKFEVGSVIQAQVRGHSFQLSQKTDDFPVF